MGGVLSSLGKGIATATLGMLLKEMGYRVALQKFDPYLNIDPGILSPFQHGEVFVTDDGAETDLDLGHYERFVDEAMSRDSSSSAGQIYETVLNKEREGFYSGKTVQVIPHVSDEIKRRMQKMNGKVDVVITEIGGTVGDIEGLPFLESVRQLRLELGPKNCLCVLLTYVPYVKSAGELKTKPSQHSAYKLREIGIQPDVLLCRSEKPFDDEIYSKIALFTNVPKQNVINAIDVKCVYEIPLVYQKSGLDRIICEHFDLKYKVPKLEPWKEFIHASRSATQKVSIAVCGKYIKHQDAYKSVGEALIHAAAYHKLKLNVKWIESEKSFKPKELEKELSGVHGILIPGGFGVEGIEGKVAIAKYAREHNVPIFGICLGLQAMVVEFARNVMGLKTANSMEFDEPNEHPVVYQMESQQYYELVGGPMRKGAYPCCLKNESLAHKAYKCNQISERHRHRYEINNLYGKDFVAGGLDITGFSPDGFLIEIMELVHNDFFVGVQFHPEFKSRPHRPHPLFRDFLAAAKDFSIGKIKGR